MEEVKRDGRAHRKRSPYTPIQRPHRAGQAHARTRELYADPAWKATQLAKMRAGLAASTGIKTRSGVPDGMRKSQAKVFWKQARFEAALTMNKLEEAGVINPADTMANEALKEALTIMRMPIAQKDRLSAARLVLDFTKAKPAQKTELTVNKAEEWLAAVTEDNAGKTNEGSDSSA